MKLLMFGWEFPPHISGGLGTACHGLTRALANQNVKSLFVLPKVAVAKLLKTTKLSVQATSSFQFLKGHNIKMKVFLKGRQKIKKRLIREKAAKK